eukprot:TRINITY_DN22264_c0_g1_i2.p1 TRINITY_DN22264_c0_g1~~TRINITY_DN22264_c0_g1_i2.p1  ORF type:complete len:411 (+),score=61.61 TRINITY_DN22264_c0_g1_i2:81-1313(+)
MHHLVVALVIISSCLCEDNLVRISLKNMQNVRYFAKVLVATESAKKAFRAQVSLDFPNILLPSTKCESCQNRKFDCNEEGSTCQPGKDSNKTFIVNEVSYVGDPWQVNYVFPGSSQSVIVPTFGYFKSEGKPRTFSGFEEAFLGLGPGKSGSLIDSLKASGLIDSRVFSLYFSNNEKSLLNPDSWLILGGYDKDLIDSEDSIQRFRTEEDSWKLAASLIRTEGDFGGNKVSSIYFDSALELNSYEESVNLWTMYSTSAMSQSKILCPRDAFDGNFFCMCQSTEDIDKLPNLRIALSSGKDLVLPSKSFFRHILGIGCLFLFKSSNSIAAKSVRLGLPFLRHFMTIYDMDKREIGIAEAQATTFKATSINFTMCSITFFIVVSSIMLLRLLKRAKLHIPDESLLQVAAPAI